eukprot:125536-Chlamydomonas_euryale.AAC.1
MYSETLGRWHTLDLLVGLAYLSHRDTNEYSALDIAHTSRCVSIDTTRAQAAALLVSAMYISAYFGRRR